MGLDVLRPLPTGLCSPQGHLPGYLHHTAHSPEQGPGLCPGHPDQLRRRGNLGGMCQGCLRKPHTQTHTHMACQRGGSLGPSHPPSEPSSPSPPLQLHPGQQHQPPEQVTCPPRQHWVFSGPGCDPQPEGRGYLPGCENPRRRHRGTCWGVGEGCHLPSRVRATPSLLPRGPLPPV